MGVFEHILPDFISDVGVTTWAPTHLRSLRLIGSLSAKGFSNLWMADLWADLDVQNSNLGGRTCIKRQVLKTRRDDASAMCLAKVRVHGLHI